MQTSKPAEVGLRTQFCRSICSFSEAVQDYVSNIEAMPDSSVTLGRGSPGDIPAGSVEDPDPHVFVPPGSGSDKSYLYFALYGVVGFMWRHQRGLILQ
jgi:hypothetical protein